MTLARRAPPATSMSAPAPNFTPVNIAVTPFAGDDAKIGAVDDQRFRPFDLSHSDQSDQLSRGGDQSRRAAERRRVEDGQRAIRADRPGGAAAGDKHRGAVPPVGHRDRRPGRRPAVHDRRRQRPPRRPSHRRRGVHPRHRRKGLLRFARRLRRRDRLEGEAPQAPGGDGHGRRQRQIPHQRRHAGGDAALLALGAAGRLHVVQATTSRT